MSTNTRTRTHQRACWESKSHAAKTCRNGWRQTHGGGEGRRRQPPPTRIPGLPVLPSITKTTEFYANTAVKDMRVAKTVGLR